MVEIDLLILVYPRRRRTRLSYHSLLLEQEQILCIPSKSSAMNLLVTIPQVDLVLPLLVFKKASLMNTIYDSLCPHLPCSFVN